MSWVALKLSRKQLSTPACSAATSKQGEGGRRADILRAVETPRQLGRPPSITGSLHKRLISGAKLSVSCAERSATWFSKGGWNNRLHSAIAISCSIQHTKLPSTLDILHPQTAHQQLLRISTENHQNLTRACRVKPAGTHLQDSVSGVHGHPTAAISHTCAPPEAPRPPRCSARCCISGVGR